VDSHPSSLLALRLFLDQRGNIQLHAPYRLIYESVNNRH
jgi:hypothetical protein